MSEASPPTALEVLGADRLRVTGRVVDVAPDSFKVTGLSRFVKLGDCIACPAPDGERLGEVVRIEADILTVKSFSSRFDRGVGAPARRIGALTVSPHEGWKGRVVDAFGRPCDGGEPLAPGPAAMPVDAAPPAALERGRTGAGISTGVKAVDVFTPLVHGQRMGVFAGSGVGKSTLLGMLSRVEGFDTVVVALVGERGREVREFLEETMGGRLQNMVTVVATGDESAMMRRLAPRTATTVAEHFRDRGENVLLVVDSVTRLAHAARDVALAAGEPPVSRGFPPSVFSELPQLLERAGPGLRSGGSITGLYSVLVDGDDHNDPIADAIRGTLDGHIVLDRRIADEGRFPAIDVLRSVSRLAEKALEASERDLVRSLRRMISRYEDTRDLRLLGGYNRGGDEALDQAVDIVPILYAFLEQGPRDEAIASPFHALSAALKQGLSSAGAVAAPNPARPAPGPGTAPRTPPAAASAA